MEDIKTALDAIKGKIDELARASALNAKSILNIRDVAALTGYSIDTIRGFMYAHQIPYYRPAGKTVFFKRTEIEAWLTTNRQPAAHELQDSAGADDFLERYRQMK